MFDSSFFKAILEHVNRFWIYHAFSFLGLLYQTIWIYVLTTTLINIPQVANTSPLTNNQPLIMLIDGLVVISLNIVFGVAVIYKKNDHF